MARTDRAALGRFVMRAKEYLTIVRAHEGALMLSTMLFADEIRDAKDVENAAGKAHKPTARQLKAAVAVIEELSGDWEPGEWKDRYRRRLQDVVARKRKGKTIKAPERAGGAARRGDRPHGRARADSGRDAGVTASGRALQRPWARISRRVRAGSSAIASRTADRPSRKRAIADLHREHRVLELGEDLVGLLDRLLGALDVHPRVGRVQSARAALERAAR